MVQAAPQLLGSPHLADIQRGLRLGTGHLAGLGVAEVHPCLLIYSASSSSADSGMSLALHLSPLPPFLHLLDPLLGGEPHSHLPSNMTVRPLPPGSPHPCSGLGDTTRKHFTPPFPSLPEEESHCPCPSPPESRLPQKAEPRGFAHPFKCQIFGISAEKVLRPPPKIKPGRVVTPCPRLTLFSIF